MATIELQNVGKKSIVTVLKQELIRVIPFRYDLSTQPQSLSLGVTYPTEDFKNISGGTANSGFLIKTSLTLEVFQTNNMALDNSLMLFPFGAGNECKQIALVKEVSAGNYVVNGIIDVSISAGATDTAYVISEIKIEVT